MGETAQMGIRSSPAKSELSFSSPTKPSLGSEKAPSDLCLEKGLLAHKISGSERREAGVLCKDMNWGDW